MTMDAAEPPRVVVESTPECADRDRADEMLRQALAQARAKGWVVTVRIQPATLPAVSAEGQITDGTGAQRAHQILPGDAAHCAELASAIGTWASGVLQAAQPAQATPPDPPADVEGGTLQPLPAPLPQAAPPGPPAPLPAGPAAPPAASLGPSTQAERASQPRVFVPPGALLREQPDARGNESAPLELGVGTFLMTGGGAGGYLGVAPFLIDDVGHAVFLRPSIAVGTSVATNITSTLAAARLDTCLRLPGRYAVRGGLQLDVCGGADAGFSYIASGVAPGTPATGQTLPFVDLGPSVDLRAEAGRVAVTLRAAGAVNVAREGFDDVTGTRVDAPMWSWRLELDFSWVLHEERSDALIAAQDKP
jgi:hypothetical protein